MFNISQFINADYRKKSEITNKQDILTQFINVPRDTLVQTRFHKKIGMGNYSLIFIMNRMKNKK